MDSSIESWILDSGAYFHSSPNKKLFRNFKSENFEKVYLADNKDLEIKRKRRCLHKNSNRKLVDIKECQIYFWSKKEPDLYWSVGQHRLCNKVREEVVEDYEGCYGGST